VPIGYPAAVLAYSNSVAARPLTRFTFAHIGRAARSAGSIRLRLGRPYSMPDFGPNSVESTRLSLKVALVTRRLACRPPRIGSPTSRTRVFSSPAILWATRRPSPAGVARPWSSYSRWAHSFRSCRGAPLGILAANRGVRLVARVAGRAAIGPRYPGLSAAGFGRSGVMKRSTRASRNGRTRTRSRLCSRTLRVDHLPAFSRPCLSTGGACCVRARPREFARTITFVRTFRRDSDAPARSITRIRNLSRR